MYPENHQELFTEYFLSQMDILDGEDHMERTKGEKEELQTWALRYAEQHQLKAPEVEV